MKDAIRLTNKTAIALRKSAKRLRTMYFAAAVLLTLLLGGAGVALGMLWLPAVPLMVVAIALLDSALMIASRSRYLSLLGQAICTEAAAREMREGAREKKRKGQAQSDMQRVKAAIREDVRNMDAYAARAQGAQPFFEHAQRAREEAEEVSPNAAPRRRRLDETQRLSLIKPER